MKIYFTKEYRSVADTHYWGELHEDGSFTFHGSEFDGDCSDPMIKKILEDGEDEDEDEDEDLYITEVLDREGYFNLFRIQEWCENIAHPSDTLISQKV